MRLDGLSTYGICAKMCKFVYNSARSWPRQKKIISVIIFRDVMEQDIMPSHATVPLRVYCGSWYIKKGHPSEFSKFKFQAKSSLLWCMNLSKNWASQHAKQKFEGWCSRKVSSAFKENVCYLFLGANLLANLSIVITYESLITFGLVAAVPVCAGTHFLHFCLRRNGIHLLP